MRFVVGAITGCQRSAEVHPYRLRITSFTDGDYKLFKRLAPWFIDGPSPYSGCLVSIKENPAKYFLLTGLSHTCLYSVFVFQPVSTSPYPALLFFSSSTFFPLISSTTSEDFVMLCRLLPFLWVSAWFWLITPIVQNHCCASAPGIIGNRMEMSTKHSLMHPSKCKN